MIETKILDDFPPWSIYPVAVVVAFGFLLSILFLIGRRMRPSDQHPRFRRARRPAFTPLIFCIVSGLAVWYLVVSMFYRFHAITIDRNRISLVYMWPRSPDTIDAADLVAVTLVRGTRPCGHMEIATQEKTFLSVSFRRCAAANEIIERIGTGHAR
ncbi:MAG TPA: hypothetical protein VIB79_23900 [Candidatus Binatia bacterium]|jgi:hypothetical protein